MPIRLFFALAIASALLAPEASAAEANDGCGFSTPRYAPKSHKPATQAPVKFQGGARVLRPVAEPCARTPGEIGV